MLSASPSLKVDFQPFGGGPLPSLLQQDRDVVYGGRLSESAGGGQRRVAAACSHIENRLAGSEIHGLAEKLAHD